MRAVYLRSVLDHIERLKPASSLVPLSKFWNELCSMIATKIHHIVSPTVPASYQRIATVSTSPASLSSSSKSHGITTSDTHGTRVHGTKTTLSPGAVTGIVVGGLFGLVLLRLIYLRCAAFRRRIRRRKELQQEASTIKSKVTPYLIHRTASAVMSPDVSQGSSGSNTPKPRTAFIKVNSSGSDNSPPPSPSIKLPSMQSLKASQPLGSIKSGSETKVVPVASSLGTSSVPDNSANGSSSSSVSGPFNQKGVGGFSPKVKFTPANATTSISTDSGLSNSLNNSSKSHSDKPNVQSIANDTAESKEQPLFASPKSSKKVIIVAEGQTKSNNDGGDKKENGSDNNSYVTKSGTPSEAKEESTDALTDPTSSAFEPALSRKHSNKYNSSVVAPAPFDERAEEKEAAVEVNRDQKSFGHGTEDSCHLLVATHSSTLSSPEESSDEDDDEMISLHSATTSHQSSPAIRHHKQSSYQHVKQPPSHPPPDPARYMPRSLQTPHDESISDAVITIPYRQPILSPPNDFLNSSFAPILRASPPLMSLREDYDITKPPSTTTSTLQPHSHRNHPSNNYDNQRYSPSYLHGADDLNSDMMSVQSFHSFVPSSMGDDASYVSLSSSLSLSMPPISYQEHLLQRQQDPKSRQKIGEVQKKVSSQMTQLFSLKPLLPRAVVLPKDTSAPAGVITGAVAGAAVASSSPAENESDSSDGSDEEEEEEDEDEDEGEKDS